MEDTSCLSAAQIKATLERCLPDARDPKTGKVDVTTLVWLAGSEYGHPEWSNDYDNPIWDIAVDVIEAAGLHQ